MGSTDHRGMSSYTQSCQEMQLRGVPSKSAVVYLGCQIQRIVVTQRKWILQSLISRSYVSMICKKASHIHVSEHCHQRHVMRSTENRSTKVQSEAGFLWVGLRSRPDIMSTVGTAASMLVNNPAEALGLTKRHAYRPLRTDHVHTDASYAYGGRRAKDWCYCFHAP